MSTRLPHHKEAAETSLFFHLADFQIRAFTSVYGKLGVQNGHDRYIEK